ncbi:hypothetical protein [Nocardioides sp.]|uniref:hypothetical protein n=1 Tax=Nocardioides sp. TaxID=35761 RepID=UPI002B276945|nr:hypothetical protein [Nocardioides sp.]
MTDGPAPEHPQHSVVDGEPASHAEDPMRRIKRLERDLASARKWSMKSTRQLHAAVSKDVRAAERRAKQAEDRAVAAEERIEKLQKRARKAEAELAEVRNSATWKAGRVVVGVPGKLKRLGRG